MRTISNQKYEITDMAHEEYPFLHRIRALRDICGEIRAGDIGGFVESESNLSAEPGDCAWIFDDAIAAGDAYVDRDACLRGDAIACGSAYVSKGSVMSGHSHAEDNAYLRGASMTGKALASGNAQIIHDPHTMGTPILSGNCKVYGGHCRRQLHHWHRAALRTGLLGNGGLGVLQPERRTIRHWAWRWGYGTAYLLYPH